VILFFVLFPLFNVFGRVRYHGFFIKGNHLLPRPNDHLDTFDSDSGIVNPPLHDRHPPLGAHQRELVFEPESIGVRCIVERR
jgi:hypothetical protein